MREREREREEWEGSRERNEGSERENVVTKVIVKKKVQKYP